MAWIMVVTAQFCLYFSEMSFYKTRRGTYPTANIDITGRVTPQSCLTLSAFPIVGNFDINDYYHNMKLHSDLLVMKRLDVHP